MLKKNEKRLLLGEGEYITKKGVKISFEDDKIKIFSRDSKEISFFDTNGKLLTVQKNTFNNLIDEEKYFFKMGIAERKRVEKWCMNALAVNKAQVEFLYLVRKALANIYYDYWISTVEVSLKDGKLYFAEKNVVAEGLTINEWMKKASEFSMKKKSRLALEEELILWYAYRIAMGLWSISYVCDNSSEEGNYINTWNPSMKCELSAERRIAGFSDGIGNTKKIVIKEFGTPCLYGGSWQSRGNVNPIASSKVITNNDMKIRFANGVIVMTEF